MKTPFLILVIALTLAPLGLCQARAEGEEQAARAQSPRVKVAVPGWAAPKLNELGFVVLPYGPIDEPLARNYRWWTREHFPVVVTTDFTLHSSHLLYDWCQRFLEIAYLRDDLLALTDSLITASMDQYFSATDDTVKDAAIANACYFIIGKRLLVDGSASGVPEPWKTTIDTELKYISEAAGMADSPLFGYKEDYTQYKPRGHYARSETFAAYFRAMMWFGRMKLLLNTRDEKVNTANARRAMLLIADAWFSSKVRGEAARDVWKRIYETTSFFAGQSDDLTVSGCWGAIAYSSQSDASDPANPRSVTQFIESCRRLPRPRILGAPAASALTTDARPWPEGTLGVTFFGQRYSPDADIMQQLTFDSVGKFQGQESDPLPFTCVDAGGMLVRGFPRGLDVMAVLGFPRAQVLLAQGKDDLYEGYAKTVARLKDELAKALTSETPKDLYSWRLRAIAALSRKPEGKLPKAYASPAWADKELTAALGPWTELKHDNILYSKQPYSISQSILAGMSKGGPVPPPPPPPQGYVEPAPEVYAAVRGGIDALRDKLKTLAYPEDEMLTRYLEQFSRNAATLEAISKKELAGEALSAGEFRFIEEIGGYFDMPVFGYPHGRDVERNFMSEEDQFFPIVADVHTDVNSKDVLEEAIGLPMAIYMVCPVNGEDSVCIGAVYSQYEFKQPMDKRLTDEEWRDAVKKGSTQDKPMALSPWMASYVATRPSR